MSKLQKIYRTLRAVRDPEIDHAMAQALATADRMSVRLIVLSLLERRNEGGLLAIVRRFDKLERDLQMIVTDQAHDLDAALRTAAADPAVATRLNAIDLIVRSGAYRLAYLVAAQLHDGDAQLTRTAAAALLSMARAVVFDRRVSAGHLRRMQWLAAAVTEACSCYHQHRRQDVLLAAAALAPRRFDRLFGYLVNRRAAAHLGMTEMIRRTDRPLVNRALLAYAAVPELEPVVIEALRAAGASRHLADFMELGHLLNVPAIAAMLRKITQAIHLLPKAATVRSLKGGRLHQAARWIATLHVPAPARVAALADVTASDDRYARLLGLRALIAVRDESAGPVIASMCHDADPRIARIALRTLIARRWGGASAVMMRLVASPHESVRRIVERHLSPVGFDRFWDHWERMDGPSRAAAGRALVKVDPRFHAQLAAKMAGGTEDDRFKAVMIARALGQESYFEKQLTGLAMDAEPRVASAAVRALGSMADSSPAAASTLRRSLRHSDDRVRANAIEAVERAGQAGSCADLLTDLASQSGNRSRANAIKALLSRPIGEALPALSSMLVDADPRHRVSALWVFEQMAVGQLARRVAAMAQHDPDARVKRRAMDVFRRFAERRAAEQTDPADHAVQAGDAGLSIEADRRQAATEGGP